MPQSLTDVDVFAGVLEQYRQELTPAGTAALKQAAPKLELDGLLPALREWILGQLTREGTAADVRGPSLPCLPFPHLATNESAVLGAGLAEGGPGLGDGWRGLPGVVRVVRALP